MPYQPHVRVTAIGRLGVVGSEKFSYSFNMDRPDFQGGLQADAAFATDVAADIRAFHSRADTGISNRAILEQVKVAEIGADGSYLNDAIVVDVVDTPGTSVSGQAGTSVAPQVALAISLNTARRGPSGKGRFYLPMPSYSLGDDLLLPAPVATAVATSVQTLINALNNTPGVDAVGGWRVVVASTKGYNTVVTGIRVGRALDTVQSRRRDLSESYSAVLPVS